MKKRDRGRERAADMIDGRLLLLWLLRLVVITSSISVYFARPSLSLSDEKPWMMAVHLRLFFRPNNIASINYSSSWRVYTVLLFELVES